MKEYVMEEEKERSIRWETCRMSIWGGFQRGIDN